MWKWCDKIFLSEKTRGDATKSEWSLDLFHECSLLCDGYNFINITVAYVLITHNLDSWYGDAELFLLLFWNSGITAKTNEDAHAEQGIKMCSNSP